MFVRCLRRPCYPPYSPQRLRVELMGAVLYSRNKCGHTAQSTWRIRLHVGANAHRTYTVYHGIRNTIPCWSSLLDQSCLDSRIDPSLANPESLIVQSCFKRPNGPYQRGTMQLGIVCRIPGYGTDRNFPNRQRVTQALAAALVAHWRLSGRKSNGVTPTSFGKPDAVRCVAASTSAGRSSRRSR